MANFF
jgi:hypothetical protein